MAIKDRDGNAMDVSVQAILGAAAHYRDELQPGDVFGPLYLNVGIGENPIPNKQVWTPFVSKPRFGDFRATHAVTVRFVNGGQGNRLTPDDLSDPVRLTSGPVEFKLAKNANRLPWRAIGRVVDGNGEPLAGVTVRASTGMGTLIGGGKTVTDESGRYDLQFGMGIMLGDITDDTPSPQTQYALISA
ncbi:MAG: carboxypeptidase regulatory-like domain-containing protein, partial [Planctomycetaceae bacterium]|nr:carboxypeptidase regulatory-like domain-containing protein [Planctomycetaceae bacterium]